MKTHQHQTHEAKLRRAYNRGWRAFDTKTDLLNPYAYGTTEFRYFARGYREAKEWAETKPQTALEPGDFEPSQIGDHASYQDN